MSSRSNNYNAQDPHVLSALHNYFIKNTTQMPGFDYNSFAYLSKTQPMDLLASNYYYQQYNTPGYIPGTLVFITSNFMGPTSTGLPVTEYGYDCVKKFWDISNFYGGFDPPRDKYNVRKTYWTGKPRKRMNL